MNDFPILGSRENIPWDVIASHEEQAILNHGHQTLRTLAERGGLDWTEALAVLEDRRYTRMNVEIARRIVLLIVADSLKY